MFRYLQQEPVNLSNCATNIHLILATNPSPAATNGIIKRSCSHTKNHVVSHPLEKYHYWRKGHKKINKNRHWNEKALVAQMGVVSNFKGVDSNSEGVNSNSEVFDSNANSQPLLVLPPHLIIVWDAVIYLNLCVIPPPMMRGCHG